MNIQEIITSAVKQLKKKSATSSFWTKWFWYLLAGGLSLLLVGSLVLGALQKSKKVAIAMHARDVLIEKQKQEKVNAVVATSEKKKQAHLKKASNHLKKANEQNKKAKELQKQAKSNKELINNLKDWDDVKKTIKR
jgi:hypothetical protein